MRALRLLLFILAFGARASAAPIVGEGRPLFGSSDTSPNGDGTSIDDSIFYSRLGESFPVSRWITLIKEFDLGLLLGVGREQIELADRMDGYCQQIVQERAKFREQVAQKAHNPFVIARPGTGSLEAHRMWCAAIGGRLPPVVTGEQRDRLAAFLQKHKLYSTHIDQFFDIASARHRDSIEGKIFETLFGNMKLLQCQENAPDPISSGSTTIEQTKCIRDIEVAWHNTDTSLPDVFTYRKTGEFGVYNAQTHGAQHKIVPVCFMPNSTEATIEGLSDGIIEHIQEQCVRLTAEVRKRGTRFHHDVIHTLKGYKLVPANYDEKEMGALVDVEKPLKREAAIIEQPLVPVRNSTSIPGGRKKRDVSWLASLFLPYIGGTQRIDAPIIKLLPKLAIMSPVVLPLVGGMLGREAALVKQSLASVPNSTSMPNGRVKRSDSNWQYGSVAANVASMFLPFVGGIWGAVEGYHVHGKLYEHGQRLGRLETGLEQVAVRTAELIVGQTEIWEQLRESREFENKLLALTQNFRLEALATSVLSSGDQSSRTLEYVGRRAMDDLEELLTAIATGVTPVSLWDFRELEQVQQEVARDMFEKVYVAHSSMRSTVLPVKENWKMTIASRVMVTGKPTTIYEAIPVPHLMKDGTMVQAKVPHQFFMLTDHGFQTLTELEVEKCLNNFCVVSQATNLLTQQPCGVIVAQQSEDNSCPVVEIPAEDHYRLSFDKGHLIYSVVKASTVELFCPDRREAARSVTLRGAGCLRVPAGCRWNEPKSGRSFEGPIPEAKDPITILDDTNLGIHYNVSLPNVKHIKPIEAEAIEERFDQVQSEWVGFKQEHIEGMTALQIFLLVLVIFVVLGAGCCACCHLRSHRYTTRVKRRLHKTVKEIDNRIGSALLPMTHSTNVYVPRASAPETPPPTYFSKERNVFLPVQVMGEPPIIRKSTYPTGTSYFEEPSQVRPELPHSRAAGEFPQQTAIIRSAVQQSAASFPDDGARFESASADAAFRERTPTAAELFKPREESSIPPSPTLSSRVPSHRLATFGLGAAASSALARVTGKRPAVPPSLPASANRPTLGTVAEWEE